MRWWPWSKKAPPDLFKIEAKLTVIKKKDQPRLSRETLLHLGEHLRSHYEVSALDTLPPDIRMLMLRLAHNDQRPTSP